MKANWKRILVGWGWLAGVGWAWLGLAGAVGCNWLGLASQLQFPSVLQNETKIENIGLTVSLLTEELAEKFDLDTGEIGIVVVDVTDGSPAADKGVQPGDIIRRLNQSAITSVEKLVEGIASAKKEGRKGVLMLIESDGQTRFVQISFDE